MIRLRNLSLLALVSCLLRGKNRKRVCILALLLGLCFLGTSFAGITNFDNLGLDSDSTAQVGYIAIWEHQSEADTEHSVSGPTSESTKELAGWIIIRYNPTTGYYELCWMTTGVFNTVAGYNAAYSAGYPGLDIFYAKQQIYDPITGEIFVPIERQSPVNQQ